MKNDVMNWTKSCKTCAAKKAPPPTRENLHSLPQPQIPFDRVGIDSKRSSDKLEYILANSIFRIQSKRAKVGEGITIQTFIR